MFWLQSFAGGSHIDRQNQQRKEEREVTVIWVNITTEKSLGTTCTYQMGNGLSMRSTTKCLNKTKGICCRSAKLYVAWSLSVDLEIHFYRLLGSKYLCSCGPEKHTYRSFRNSAVNTPWTHICFLHYRNCLTRSQECIKSHLQRL